MVSVTSDTPDSPGDPATSDTPDTPDTQSIKDLLGPDHDDTSGLSRAQVFRLVARAPDSYVLLLLLLVADYVIISVEWTGGFALVFRSAVLAVTVLLTFHTSRVGASVQNAARVLVALAFLGTIGVAIGGGDVASGSVVLLMSILLLACPVAIGWRLVHHSRVTGETIAGAVCIYVLIGMIFANLDYGLQLAAGSSFFAQSGPHNLPDFAYFSYITMATVGYGDLTPTTGLPRTMAVLEALIGQVFLVVLLARLVSLYKGPRGWREGIAERIAAEEADGEAGAAQA
jgi:hypothetical protein